MIRLHTISSKNSIDLKNESFVSPRKAAARSGLTDFKKKCTLSVLTYENRNYFLQLNSKVLRLAFYGKLELTATRHINH